MNENYLIVTDLLIDLLKVELAPIELCKPTMNDSSRICCSKHGTKEIRLTLFKLCSICQVPLDYSVTPGHPAIQTAYKQLLGLKDERFKKLHGLKFLEALKERMIYLNDYYIKERMIYLNDYYIQDITKQMFHEVVTIIGKDLPIELMV